MLAAADVLSSPCNIFQVTPMASLALDLSVNMLLQANPAANTARKNLFSKFRHQSPSALRSDPGILSAPTVTNNTRRNNNSYFTNGSDCDSDSDGNDEFASSIAATPLLKADAKHSRAACQSPSAVRSFNFGSRSPPLPPRVRPSLIRAQSESVLKRNASMAFPGVPKLLDARRKQVAHWSAKITSSSTASSTVFGRRGLITVDKDEDDNMLFSPEMPAKKRNYGLSGSSDVSTTMLPMICASKTLPDICMPKLTLPCKPGVLPIITPDTVSALLDGHYNKPYYIIDCRFPYEYSGGHIRSALNINSYEQLHSMFLEAHETMSKDAIIVFHCEFSSQRAPQMAQDLRNKDRKLNEHNYPALFYPEVYLLEGGYKEFYLSRSHRCTPQEYVTMHDSSYIHECRKQLATRKLSLERSRSYSDAEMLRTDLAKKKLLAENNTNNDKNGKLFSFSSMPSLLPVPTNMDIASSAVTENVCLAL